MTNTCTAHNGTYSCTLAAGHAGRHVATSAVVDSSNVRTGTRLACFADAYSAVTFTTSTR